jgi:hypothetical protein
MTEYMVFREELERSDSVQRASAAEGNLWTYYPLDVNTTLFTYRTRGKIDPVKVGDVGVCKQLVQLSRA